jgi:hypothetical protein
MKEMDNLTTPEDGLMFYSCDCGKMHLLADIKHDDRLTLKCGKRLTAFCPDRETRPTLLDLSTATEISLSSFDFLVTIPHDPRSAWHMTAQDFCEQMELALKAAMAKVITGSIGQPRVYICNCPRVNFHPKMITGNIFQIEQKPTEETKL